MNKTDSTRSADENEIVHCASCGQRLRLPKSGSYRCPKCRTVGKVDDTPSYTRTAPHIKDAFSFLKINKDRLAVGFVIFAFVVVLIWMAQLKSTPGSNLPQPTVSSTGTQAQQAAPEIPLPERPLPRNGSTRISSRRTGEAPFKIATKPGAHNLVKLRNLNGTGETITIFIHDGKTVEVDVPTGSYELKLASGRKWYGYKKYFGKDGAYSKADKTLTFEYQDNGISGHEIQLFGVINGNLKTNETYLEDF